MKKHVFIFVLGLFILSLKASVTAYFNYGVFNVPSGSPFIETYLTVIGRSIKHIPVNGGLQGSINVKVLITKGGELYTGDNYNLLGPVAKDSLSISSFIDNHRYALPNGAYTIEITLSDNNEANGKKFTYKENFVINYTKNEISCSSIQPLESFTKSNGQSSISKSGYDLIPYNVNYFSDKENKLSFYFETYGTDTVLGKNQSFVYTYFIERKEDMVRPEGLGGFKKQTTSKVNPLLAQIDISKLESGNYNLVIELRDKDNKVQLEKKWFFQRQSKIQKPLVFNKEKRTVYEFFGNYNSLDTLKMFVECLWPISTLTERDYQINVSTQKDPQFMKNYIVDFWEKRSGDSLDPLALWLSYYDQVKIVNQLFKCGKQKGYYTDRGRMYLQYGKPDTRVVQPSEPYSYPYEIWQYYRLQDKSNGQFYTNKRCVFVNKTIADDCYKLIHTDIRGEIYNDKWRYEITKRDTNPNIDATQPTKQQGNNYDDFYNNPR
jgi:GWxTD domain-containing protein